MAVRRVRRHVTGLSWVQKSLLSGLVLAVTWTTIVETGIDNRLFYDGLLYLVAPAVLGYTHGKRLGWRVNRRAVRNAVVLGLFVLPFYLVGSTLPSIRAYYPIWETSTALGEFVPHALKLFVLALAAETFFRGLLCVSVSELGPKAAFISPLIYALQHVYKPPIEFVLSGPTDVLFGLVDYDANSILPSVVAHGAGLVLLDWLVLHPPLFDPMGIPELLRLLPV